MRQHSYDKGRYEIGYLCGSGPHSTYYYHTWHDVPERFELETVGDGFDVILGVIDKIDKFQQANGFNGPQK